MERAAAATHARRGHYFRFSTKSHADFVQERATSFATKKNQLEALLDPMSQPRLWQTRELGGVRMLKGIKVPHLAEKIGEQMRSVPREHDVRTELQEEAKDLVCTDWFVLRMYLCHYFSAMPACWRASNQENMTKETFHSKTKCCTRPKKLYVLHRKLTLL